MCTEMNDWHSINGITKASCHKPFNLFCCLSSIVSESNINGKNVEILLLHNLRMVAYTGKIYKNKKYLKKR